MGAVRRGVARAARRRGRAEPRARPARSTCSPSWTDWLPSVEELAGPPSAAVLCHGALDDSNVMGWLDGRRFVPTGVIDFAHAFVGHPLAELGPIWWSLLRQDAIATGTLLDAWRPASTRGAALPRRALAWALTSGPADVPWRGAIDAAGLDELAERWLPATSSNAA